MCFALSEMRGNWKGMSSIRKCSELCFNRIVLVLCGGTYWQDWSKREKKRKSVRDGGFDGRNG